MSDKPRIVKDYDKIDESIIEQIKLNYPYGFDRNLVTFKNSKGELVSALPFETEDRYYLVRMTKAEAQEIIEDDDDYNDDGELKKSSKELYTEKHDDEFDFDEEAADEMRDDDNDDDDDI